MAVTRRLAGFAVILCALLGSGLQAGDPGGIDAIAGYLEDRLRAGSRDEIEAVVEALVAHPVRPAGADELESALIGILSVRGETDLVDRLRARRSGVRVLGPPRPLAFPRDHGAHRGSFTEWWYFNGNLEVGGRRLGYQVTFFRTALVIYFIHVAISDLAGRNHVSVRRYLSPASCETSSRDLDVRMGDHRVWRDAAGLIRIASRIGGRGRRLELELTPLAPPALIGGNGWVDMPEGTSSRYYSHTRLETRGWVTGSDGVRQPVSGASWFDHQWGHFIAMFRGWDWFGLQMEDGSDYLIAYLRPGRFSPGSFAYMKVTPGGGTVTGTRGILERGRTWTSPRSGDRYLTSWHLELPDLSESFVVTTPLDDQEMPAGTWYDLAPSYWEGVVDAERVGSDGGRTGGTGYCEQFPLANRDRKRRELFLRHSP